MRRSSYPEQEVSSINWQAFKLILPYLFEYKKRIAFAMLCLILTKIASVYLPFILKDIVDTLDANNSDTDAALVIVPLGLVAAYGMVRLSIVVFAEIRDTLFGRVTERAIRRIGLKVFRHLHSLDLDFHLNRQTGGLSRDIDRGTTGINFLMRFMVFNIVPTLLEIVMVVTILFVNYGIWFALITLSSILFYITYSIYATELRTRYVRAANKADSSSNTRAIDSLLNYETVKYFTNEDYEANRYDSELENWEVAKRKNRLTMFALNGGQALIIAVAMTTNLALAAIQVESGAMTLGDFVLINAFMMQIFIPLNFLGFVYREIKGSLANIEQMFDLLERKPKVVDSDNADQLQVKQGVIEFNNVAFHYQSERPILQGISFKIEPGQKVAVVGESGAGKSTLVKLLFRFYDTASGTITIDGENIAGITLESLRHAIGIVPQDTVLFNDTIFENIRYGRPAASDDEVYEAIRLAHVGAFIGELPKGKDTMVGERGLKLSGGEKQRISIARAFLKNSPIILLDEATSSLDSESEEKVQNAVMNLTKNKTTLVIAHRLSTIIRADKIIVVNQGQIVDIGTHNELLKKSMIYKNLYSKQLSA